MLLFLLILFILFYQPFFVFECISFSDTYGDLFHALSELMEAKGLVWKEEVVMISDWEQVRVTIGMDI